MNKDLKKMLKAAEAAGWTIEECRSRHYRAKSPDGTSMVLISRTPSDQRAVKNVLADFRRAGLDLNAS